MLKCVFKKILRYFEQNSDDQNIIQQAAALDIPISKISSHKNIEKYLTPIE